MKGEFDGLVWLNFSASLIQLVVSCRKYDNTAIIMNAKSHSDGTISMLVGGRHLRQDRRIPPRLFGRSLREKWKGYKTIWHPPSNSALDNAAAKSLSPRVGDAVIQNKQLVRIETKAREKVLQTDEFKHDQTVLPKEEEVELGATYTALIAENEDKNVVVTTVRVTGYGGMGLQARSDGDGSSDS